MEMRITNRKKTAGFTLIELMVAMGTGLVVMAVAIMLFRQAIDSMQTLTQRAEMQQNARVGVNWIAQDLSLAATGIPIGGFQLPSGGGATNALFGCDAANCYLPVSDYTDDRLYGITPGDGLGPIINGVATDVVTLAYDDVNFALDQFPIVSVTSTSIVVDAATNPPIDDVAVGIVAGDVLSICNTNGCAAVVVTNVNNDTISFSGGDPLNFNQAAAPVGNVGAILALPCAAPCVPETRAKRILVVTYFIEVPPGPDGAVGTPDDGFARLMRQINAHPPVPVAEIVENLQIQYDIFDDTLGVVTSGLDDAGGVPNQIRKATITVTSRSPLRGLFRQEFERISLNTSVTPRNMSYRDRYQ
jgi:type II secretory pathway pseudopilin PulG